MPEIASPNRPTSADLPQTLTPATSPAVQEALAEIGTDSQARPDQYLADTVVPHGGE
jgi:hypothetical protein